ncbi:hypothetical protein HMI54_000936 [Coelomomyces lativittatus]|nr:hypothetical protein HMI56_003919 [Coelomomyces lativittatus]KAJ1518408.1 hypothetical protein HMI54_000936 [Coelomomyces lativittatus]
MNNFSSAASSQKLNRIFENQLKPIKSLSPNISSSLLNDISKSKPLPTSEAKIQSLLKEIQTLKCQIESIESELLDTEIQIAKEEKSIEEIMLKTTALESLDHEFKCHTQVMNEYIEKLHSQTQPFNKKSFPQTAEDLKPRLEALLDRLSPHLLTNVSPEHSNEFRSLIETFQTSVDDPQTLLDVSMDFLSIPLDWPRLPTLQPPQGPLQAALSKTLKLQSLINDQVQWLTGLKAKVRRCPRPMDMDVIEQRALQACLEWLAHFPFPSPPSVPASYQDPEWVSSMPTVVSMIQGYWQMKEVDAIVPPPLEKKVTLPPLALGQCLDQIENFQLSPVSLPLAKFIQWYSLDHALDQLHHSIHAHRRLALEAKIYETILRSWKSILKSHLPSDSIPSFLKYLEKQWQQRSTKISEKELSVLQTQPSIQWHEEIEKLREEKSELLEGHPWAKFLNLEKDIQDFKLAQLKHFKSG